MLLPGMNFWKPGKISLNIFGNFYWWNCVLKLIWNRKLLAPLIEIMGKCDKMYRKYQKAIEAIWWNVGWLKGASEYTKEGRYYYFKYLIYTIGVHWAHNYVQTVWQDCGKLFQLHPNGINGEIFKHDSFPNRKYRIVLYRTKQNSDIHSHILM